jgi:hypothetical protein
MRTDQQEVFNFRAAIGLRNRHTPIQFIEPVTVDSNHTVDLKLDIQSRLNTVHNAIEYLIFSNANHVSILHKLTEEYIELVEAVLDGDLVKAIDGIVDLKVVANAMACAWGVDLELLDENGHVVKTEHYRPPAIAGTLELLRSGPPIEASVYEKVREIKELTLTQIGIHNKPINDECVVTDQEPINPLPSPPPGLGEGTNPSPAPGDGHAGPPVHGEGEESKLGRARGPAPTEDGEGEE